MSFIVWMNFLSVLKTHHSRQTKNMKKMINEITGQMAILSIF